MFAQRSLRICSHLATRTRVHTTHRPMATTTKSKFIPTADWCDMLLDDISYANTEHFRHFGACKRFHGEIVTVQCLEDNSFVRKALSKPGEGKVLVVDGGGSMNRAMLGDNVAQMAMDNKWNGVIINGCVRDSAAIATMQIGIQARGTHPRKTNKLNVGAADIEVCFAGTCFRPGDFVVSDEDGIVCGEKRLFEEQLDK